MTTAIAPENIAPPEEARCLGCGYQLRGLTRLRCPECARAFDPTDPWTMNVGRPHGKLVRALLSPIGRPTYAVATAATLAVFWWVAALPSAPLAMLIGLWTWTAIYAYRLVRYVGRVVCSRIYRRPLRREPRFLFLVLILLTGVMMWTRFPFYVVFALHRPALDRVAKHYYEEVPMVSPPPAPKRIGLYAVEAIYLDVNGVTFRLGNHMGFRYAPEPTWSDRHYYRPVMGKWRVARNFESEILVRPVDFLRYKLRPLLRKLRS